MYAYERLSAHPTLDINFLGANINNYGEIIISAFKEICAMPCEEDKNSVNFDLSHITAQNITETRWRN